MKLIIDTVNIFIVKPKLTVFFSFTFFLVTIDIQYYIILCSGVQLYTVVTIYYYSPYAVLYISMTTS